jgi:hypothetical protein|tara:strand:+ start:4808 stop:4954 length:147 start_codon:yes stop_codon:yes gene_type:complete
MDKCWDCGKIKKCIKLFGFSYCDDCNSKACERIDKKTRYLDKKTDDYL